MDIVIINMGDLWGIATPDDLERAMPPLSIIGDWSTWRIWRESGLPDVMWEAAKVFYIRLAGAFDELDAESVAA